MTYIPQETGLNKEVTQQELLLQQEIKLDLVALKLETFNTDSNVRLDLVADKVSDLKISQEAKLDLVADKVSDLKISQEAKLDLVALKLETFNTDSNIRLDDVADKLLTTNAETIVRQDKIVEHLSPLTSWVSGQATIASTTVSVNIIPTPTVGRKSFLIKLSASATQPVYIGPTSGVTASTGYELTAGESLILECDETAFAFVIGTTVAPQTLSFIEIV